jgi:hypothetical protein
MVIVEMLRPPPTHQGQEAAVPTLEQARFDTSLSPLIPLTPSTDQDLTLVATELLHARAKRSRTTPNLPFVIWRQAPCLPWYGIAFRPTESAIRSGCVSHDHPTGFRV